MFFIFNEQSTFHFKFPLTQFYLEFCLGLKRKQAYNTAKIQGINGCGREWWRFSAAERKKENRIQKVRQPRLTIWKTVAGREAKKNVERQRSEVREYNLQLYSAILTLKRWELVANLIVRINSSLWRKKNGELIKKADMKIFIKKTLGKWLTLRSWQITWHRILCILTRI